MPAAPKFTLTKDQITHIGVERVRSMRGLLDKFSVFTGKLQSKYDEKGGGEFFGKWVERQNKAWLCEKAAVIISRAGVACVIQGDIYEKWKKLGGMNFGIPDSDEMTTPDTIGRYNHFNGGDSSIYWTPHTGAQGIWGDIRKRWAALGYERSYLGYPTSDEADFDGGRANSFEHGDICWWPDTGSIDLKGVVLHYTGFFCQKEGEDNTGNAFDNSVEPYFIFASTSPSGTATVNSKVYDDVDSGEAFPDLLELYRGRSYGVSVNVIMMEHDMGDPNAYKDKIKESMMAAHAAGTLALGAIPAVGPALAAVLGPLLLKIIPDIADAFNSLLDTQDDYVQEKLVLFSPKELVMLAAKTTNSNYKGIGYKKSINIQGVKGQGGQYTIYFGIVPM